MQIGRFLVSTFALSLGTVSLASANPTETGDITTRGEAKQTSWTFDVGAAALLSPNFPGDDAYSVSAVPYLRLAYKDKFFASVQEGMGYTLIDEKNFRAGPLIGLDFGRDEEEGSPFRLFGSETTDLIGLGDIDPAISLGGFAEAGFDKLQFAIRAGQAITGHEGFTSDVSIRYKDRLTGYGPPIFYSFGPSIEFGDSQYMNSYFGITAQQSTLSGLALFQAGGGVVSYGINATALMPLTDNVSVNLFASVKRLSDKASDSPLVRERGTPTQAFFGLATAYRFD
jgi:outer membrane protein